MRQVNIRYCCALTNTKNKKHMCVLLKANVCPINKPLVESNN